MIRTVTVQLEHSTLTSYSNLQVSKLKLKFLIGLKIQRHWVPGEGSTCCVFCMYMFYLPLLYAVRSRVLKGQFSSSIYMWKMLKFLFCAVCSLQELCSFTVFTTLVPGWRRQIIWNRTWPRQRMLSGEPNRSCWRSLKQRTLYGDDHTAGCVLL